MALDPDLYGISPWQCPLSAFASPTSLLTVLGAPYCLLTSGLVFKRMLWDFSVSSGLQKHCELPGFSNGLFISVDCLQSVYFPSSFICSAWAHL